MVGGIVFYFFFIFFYFFFFFLQTQSLVLWSFANQYNIESVSFFS